VHVEEAEQQCSRRTRLPTVLGLPRDIVTSGQQACLLVGSIVSLLRVCALYARSRRASPVSNTRTHSSALSSSENGESSEGRPLHALARQQQDAELRRGIPHAPRCRRASMVEVLTPRIRWHCLWPSAAPHGQTGRSISVFSPPHRVLISRQ
jgi:hypothetical protein